MTFIGAQVNKLNGGLSGGQPSERVAVLVVGGAAIAGKLELYRAYELLQIEDAESIGITAESDSANKLLSHYHISEIFRLSPETRVHLIVVPIATKVSELKSLPDFIPALRSIEDINTIAVAGLTDDEEAGIAAQGMQLLVDNFANDFIYIDAVLLEGKGSYLAESISDNADLRILDCPNVSLIWAQDPTIAAQDITYKYHAGVGSALGMLLARYVHENLGSVDIENKPRARKAQQDYPLTDARAGRWLSAALSNGRLFSSISGPDQKKLDELGYIYAGYFPGYGGCFLSNSHTCTKSDDDYCYIERNAIWNKAARIVRNTLLPRVRSKVQSDATTGLIRNTTITDWDGRVRRALEPMVTARNIADFDIFINPKQAAISDKPFNIRIQLVADGIVHEFEIDLGFTKSI
ncbi:DUF2586 family protein [Dysgonomonas sp. ZJ279]|uniref:DUF2586 family protein n=1 Tax=Dysgonomonas sp. ZJ279 TaxID=2709796 RepID=UPI0013E9D0C2|nr:DUF2586 family protein [Dysgonomonas sp. ZJ279]